MIKKDKGITLISLSIAVIIILTITGMILYSAKDGIYIEKLTNMQNDIKNLRDKVSSYYSEYGEIPAKTEYPDITNLQAAGVIGANDTGKFFILELEKLEGLTLNYGEDYEKYKVNDYTNLADLTDIYIINETSHNIFYVEGIRVKENDGTKIYYTDYTEGDKEAVILKKLEDWHEETNENGETVITNGIVELKIGDYVNYNPQKGAKNTEYTSLKKNNGYQDQTFKLADYQYGWRVLGIDEETERIILISEDYIGPDSTEVYYGRTYFKLNGKEGFVKGEEELNNISQLYGQGTGASESRSITLEDINQLTGYDDTTQEFRKGTVSEYGKDVTYYWNGTQFPYYDVSGEIKGNLKDEHFSFTWYNQQQKMWETVSKSTTATEQNKEKITTIKNDIYVYYPDTLSEDPNGEIKGISKTSNIYKILFTNSQNSAIEESKKGTTEGCSYWLASSGMAGDVDFVRHAIKCIDPGMVSGYTMFVSTGYDDGQFYGVRPVIFLNADITITGGNGIDGSTQEKAWQIQ